MGKVIKFTNNKNIYISNVDRMKRRALNIIEKLLNEKYHLIQENQRLKIELEKKLSNSLYAQGAEAISEGIANSIKNIEKEETSNVNSKY